MSLNIKVQRFTRLLSRFPDILKICNPNIKCPKDIIGNSENIQEFDNQE